MSTRTISGSGSSSQNAMNTSQATTNTSQATTNTSQSSNVNGSASAPQSSDTVPVTTDVPAATAAEEVINLSKMEKIQQCLQEHSGQGKCNIKLSVDNDLDVNLTNFAGMFLEERTAFPSLFNTNINLKVEGGMECSKLVKCIIDAQKP